MFKSPFRTTLHVLLILALQGLADWIGDRGMFWLTVFGGFVLPALIMKEDEQNLSHDLVKLSGRGEIVIQSLFNLWETIELSIPKFADLARKSTD
jgi:hypothetical protein